MEFDQNRNDDKDYVLDMVSKQGSLLDLASDRLKNDRDVVMAAIKQDGNALEFASKDLKDDKEIVLESIKKVGWTACYVSERLSDDKETMLDAVKINGQELYYASEKLRDDDDVVMAAVTNKGLILKYASKRLRANKDIVKVAVLYALGTAGSNPTIPFISSGYLFAQYNASIPDLSLIHIFNSNSYILYKDSEILPQYKLSNMNFVIPFKLFSLCLIRYSFINFKL